MTTYQRLVTTYQRLVKKQHMFDNLRQAIAIALPNTTKGLNDTGEDISKFMNFSG